MAALKENVNIGNQVAADTKPIVDQVPTSPRKHTAQQVVDQLKVKRMRIEAKLPVRGSHGAAGYDLSRYGEVVV